MSRGLGRVELAILKAFEAKPDTAFTVDELHAYVFPDAEWIEKKHTVSIIRAAKKLSAEDIFGLDIRISGSRGNPLILFRKYNVMSYAMARLMEDYPHASEQALRATLLPGGRYHDTIAEGGAWLRHIRMAIAERDGDHELAAKLEEEQAASLAATLAKIRAVIPR